jgi:hypothetical protein
MITNRSFFGIACRAAAFSFLMAGSASLMQAQQPSSVIPAPRTPLFLASEPTPLDLTGTSSSSSSSNSSSDATPSYAKLDFDSSAALGNSQPPPRRTYGRPNYSGGNTNPDGSNKYTFIGGAGFTLPTGGTHNYAATSWKIQVGAGRNFNKTLGVLVQFDYDHFGMQSGTLNKQLALYNSLCPTCGFTQLGGNIHDWSFTLDPIVNYYTTDTWGAYVVGGLGYYHKYTQITTPTSGTCYSPYYGYYTCTGNSPVDWYTSNAFGLNAGLGFTRKVSKFANERLFVEARYIWTDNQPRPYNVSGTTNYFNAFPQASARTTYIPVTFGLRF